VCSGAAFAADELPRHEVALSAFLVGETEVTVDQFCEMLNARADWFTVMAATDDGTSNECYGVIRLNGTRGPAVVWLTSVAPSVTNIAGVWQSVRSGYSNHPMVHVTWHGAALFCNYLSLRDGLRPLYATDEWAVAWAFVAETNAGYHLPTEAQWEHAAAGTCAGEAYPWGRFMLYDHCNVYASDDPCESNDPAQWPATTPVRSYAANSYGLYDVIGNVREWCHDWYDAGYYGHSPLQGPTGPGQPAAWPAGGSNRVTRGGGWSYVPGIVSVSGRTPQSPVTGAMDLGFRLSRFGDPVPEPQCPGFAMVALGGILAQCRRYRS
jgi:formylglycine-generating enzyme required for sulfatase activity